MKKLLIAILLLISSLAWAGSTTVVVGQPPAVPTQNTSINMSSSNAYAFMEKANGTCSTARTGTAAWISTTNSTGYVGGYYDSGAYHVLRGYGSFDTSSLPDDCTITKVEFHVLTVDDSFSTSALSAIVAEGTQENSVTSADWADYGSAWSGATTISQSAGSWNTITFNSTGIAGINKTGYTKIVLLSNTDFGGSCYNTPNAWPTLRWGSSSSNKPYLYIEYYE